MEFRRNIKLNISNKNGFTLIEVVSAIVIMGVMFSVGIKKLDFLSYTAAGRVLESGLKELNAREALVWTKIKLTNNGWTSDTNVFAELDTNLGHEFHWTAGPDVTGGTLRFKSKSIALTRIASSNSSVGRWN